MAKSELCEKCAHTKVCFKDKNLLGDVFVAGNPMKCEYCGTEYIGQIRIFDMEQEGGR